jgi:S-adenosylmethionine hydrolase
MDKKKNIKKEENIIKKFDITIDEFGEIKTNISIEEINNYLNENVSDKKLKNFRSEEE